MQVNKKKAVALGYNRSKDNAPRANRIIDLAKEHDIPIKEDPDLIEILSKVEVDQEIPPNLYKAVAEIFSFLYKITKK